MKLKTTLTKIAVVSVSALMLMSVGALTANAQQVKTQNPRVERHFKPAKETTAEKKNDRRYNIKPNERRGRNYIKQDRRYIRRHNHDKYIRQNNKDHKLTKPELVDKIVTFDMNNLDRKFRNARKKVNYKHRSRAFKRGFDDGEWNFVTKRLLNNRDYKRGYIEATAFSVSPRNHVTKRIMNDARNGYKVIRKTRQIFSDSVPIQIDHDALAEVYASGLDK